jgi:hypothetical protein
MIYTVPMKNKRCDIYFILRQHSMEGELLVTVTETKKK